MDKSEIKEFIQSEIQKEVFDLRKELSEIKHVLDKILTIARLSWKITCVAGVVLAFVLCYLVASPKEVISQLKQDVQSHSITLEKHEIRIDENDHRTTKLEARLDK